MSDGSEGAASVSAIASLRSDTKDNCEKCTAVCIAKNAWAGLEHGHAHWSTSCAGLCLKLMVGEAGVCRASCGSYALIRPRVSQWRQIEPKIVADGHGARRKSSLSMREDPNAVDGAAHCAAKTANSAAYARRPRPKTFPRGRTSA